MGLFGGNDRKLAETKYAGKESASQKAERKKQEKAARTKAANPSVSDPASIYEAVRNTPESKARRNPIARARGAQKTASETSSFWNR